MIRPLFKHEPRSEQEVVALFTALLPYLDTSLVLDRVQTPFPDCTALDESGKPVRIEFELYGSHFVDHRHPVDRCDMMVCWADDWGQWPEAFEVWELHKLVASHGPHLIENVREIDPSLPWTEDGMFAWAHSEGTPSHDQTLARRVIRFAREESLGPQWLTGPLPGFAVRDTDQ